MRFVVDEGKEKTLLPKILRACLRLFAEKGIDGTTIKDIAKRARVAEGALYRHFKGKNELAYYVFSTNLDAFSEGLLQHVKRAPDVRQKLAAYVSFCLRAFEEDREMFAYLILSEHRELKNFPRSHMHPGKVILQVVELGQKSGAFPKIDPQIGTSLVIGCLHRLCVARMYGRLPKDLRTYEQSIVRSLWASLTA